MINIIEYTKCIILDDFTVEIESGSIELLYYFKKHTIIYIKLEKEDIDIIRFKDKVKIDMAYKDKLYKNVDSPLGIVGSKVYLQYFIEESQYLKKKLNIMLND